jgi:Tat protein secretion system quality control protein TatD with DNase activity
MVAVAFKIAEELKISLSELASITTANAEEVYGKKG